MAPEKVVFTCTNCGQQEDLSEDALETIVRMRPELVAGILSSDGGRTRGSVAFERVQDEEGKQRLVVRRRFPGVEIKST